MELTSEIAAYIKKHADVDVPSFLLRKDHPDHLPIRFIAQQIESRRKARVKLPNWANRLDLIFPTPISIEQSSSELTAAYKANLFTGNRALDLTGGFGVDTAAFARTFHQVDYVEQNQPLAEIANHNFQQIPVSNVSCFSQSAEKFLETTQNSYDLIYLDPDRRPQKDKREIGLENSKPNVLTLSATLLEKASKVLVKASPMMDIRALQRQLPHLHSIHVVVVKGECKELLLILERQPNTGKTLIHASHLSESEEPHVFSSEKQDQDIDVPLALPQRYIYEPHAGILKAGISHALAFEFGLSKLHPFTFLYTSENHRAEFPGRAFRLIGQKPLKAKHLKQDVSDGKANITTRNFPQTVAQIRRKTGLKEGGDTYLFACTLEDNSKKILICRKV